MFFPTLQLTSAGQALLSKVIGESKVLAFSRMAIGDGTTAGTTSLTHQAINIPINYYSLSTGAVSMTGTIDNSSLQSGVNARELGVFAIDPDDESEILYAYSFNGENPAYIPPASSSSYERIALTVVVAIGSAQNVTVDLDPFIGYATTEQFNAHVNDDDNPHGVTAAQTGALELGIPAETEEVDLNNLTEPGCYSVLAANLNKPAHSSSNLVVSVFGLRSFETSAVSGRTLLQICTDANSGKVYARYYFWLYISEQDSETEEWSDWALVTNDDYHVAGYFDDIPSLLPGVLEDSTTISFIVKTPKSLEKITSIEVNNNRMTCRVYGVGGYADSPNNYDYRDYDTTDGNTFTLTKEDERHIKITVTGTFSGTAKTPIMIKFRYPLELRFRVS